ncbi:protein serine/threonine phosphatase [Kribbella flavida DSM 17836]|uniref:Protein serine/threonine phosphatase n=1 Tax=Kribbella flavida (strain DSM 17836 / JCM 10339 / NBRC 14399) TaxID=479435 RepID=D2PQK5_KRIFD|nr:protein phosphatase 2C domain-containing protein [Kribbella flavida]ADB29192.1 protein serine/threonine phosphatase [Kribbella flavida DSM 17836]
MTLSLDYAALSDVGRVRRNNEDSAYAGPHLLLLADGMGGAAAGEVASAAAVQVLRRLDTATITGEDMIEALAGAVHRANERLSELVEEDPEREGMGSTVTALMFDGEQLGLAHLGDSRAYRMRDGRLQQLSHDHTFVQSLVDEGRISQEEAFTHPHRNLILRVLDGRPDSDPDLQMLDVQAGDRLLLCSDGLPDYVNDDVIAAAMADGTPDSVVVDLITHALEAGSNDNVTCIVADVVETAQTGAGAPQLVGAAAELAQGGTGGAEPTIAVRGGGGEGAGASESGEHLDPEELRYAPRPPKRFIWLRRLGALAVVLALVAGGGWFAYSWSQQQYYVGTDGDYVAIYRGVDEQVPGLTLSRVHEQKTLEVDKLPTYNREQVEGTIQADDLAAAREIVEELQRAADACAGQQAKTTPSPRPGTPAPSTPPASGKPVVSKPPVSVPVAPPSSTPTNGAVGPDDCDGVR